MPLPLNIDLQQILLHWMNFAILAGGLYFLLYKPVKDFMDKREAYYRDREERTAQALREAEEAKAGCQAKLDAAGEEARKLRAQAQSDAQKAAQERLDQAGAEAKHILLQARADAEKSKEELLRSSQRELKELAVQAAQKLMFQPGADPMDQFLELTEKRGTDDGK